MKRKKSRLVRYEQLVTIVKEMSADPEKRRTVVQYCGTAEPWVLGETLSEREARVLLAKLCGTNGW